MAQADLAVREASRATATQHAPLEIHQAQERLEQSLQAMEEEDNRRATRLAEEALVQARLAEEKARTAVARETVAELRSSIEALRAEATRASERSVHGLEAIEPEGVQR